MFVRKINLVIIFKLSESHRKYLPEQIKRCNVHTKTVIIQVSIHPLFLSEGALNENN